jgi:putative ABC transport system permease protein
MFRVIRKGLLAHKRRLTGTVLAIFLGVGFLSGTLVLGDTLGSNFDDLFQSANAGTDAVIRGASTVSVATRGPGIQQRGLVDGRLLDRVRAVAGVAAAEPSVLGYGQLIGTDGAAVGGNGPPRQAGNWIDDPGLTPYRLVAGRPPAGTGEVVINRGAARDGGLRVGDSTTVQTPEPVRVRVVGIATWNSADGFGRSTFVAFGLADAQRYVTKRPGQLTSVLVRAGPKVSEVDLVNRLRPLLPPGTEALTGAELVRETTDSVSGGFLAFFKAFLLVFAGVALLVATFSIVNTFSILVAQRSRESALLRALGATRRQVLGSVLAEAAVVGTVASGAGLLGGLGIASLLKALFNGVGFALPDTGLVLTARTILVSLAVGLLVTLLAGIAPAVAASRVPPLAALRAVAVGRTGSSRRRAVAGTVLTLAGGTLAVAAVAGSGSGALTSAGLGAVLTTAGIVVLGPSVARPVSRLLGAPLPALRGATGALARGNAMRNPRRTASTASALLVGVGVVTLFTVLGASIRASTDASVRQSFGGDLAVTAPGFGAGFSPRLADDVHRLPEVQAAAGLARAAVQVDGTGTAVTVSDPGQLGQVFDLDVGAGSLGALGQHGFAVNATTAAEHGWQLGSTVRIGFPDGSVVPMTVGAVYSARTVVGDYLLPRAAWTAHATVDIDTTVLVGLRPGVDLAAGRAAVQRVARGYGSPAVRDRAEWADALSTGVNTMLTIVYALLALAVLIALMGIANTLSLSIHERTRELGVLRALGLTRRQLRSIVRWESVLIAVFGTLGGLGLGVFLGWALVNAAAADIGSFAAPPARLLVVLGVGAAVGVLAAARPARRAARLDLLAAIATD